MLIKQTQVKTAVLLLLALIFLAITQSVRADGIFMGEKVALGEVVENDAIMNGTAVMVNGVIEGDLFVVGKTVTINGTVEGSLFALAETVIIAGEVQGSGYVTAVSAQLHEGGQVDRTLYVVAASLLVEKGATIGRDLMALTLGVRFDGNVVQRDTVVISGILEVIRWVMNNVNQITTGKSVAFLEPQITFDTRERSSSYRVRAQDGAEVSEAEANVTVAWLLTHTRLFTSYLLVGILMLWWLPALHESWADKVGERPFATFGAGLVFYIVGFIATLLLFVLLCAVGIGLAALTFWGLAWTWWGLTLSSLSLAFWLFVTLVAYASKVIVAYWGGRWLLHRFWPRAQRRIWALLLGLTLLVLLIAIPYAGWAISFAITFVGMGAVALIFLASRRAGLVTAVAPTAK